MPRPASACCVRPVAGSATLARAFTWLLLVAIGACLLAPLAARADDVELQAFDVVRDEDGVYLTFAARFELPRSVEEVLQRGVPLHFVAEAEVYRSRWWWLNPRVAQATRSWRLAWQPLTRSWRVSFGGLHQNFENLSDALAAVRGALRWKIADASQIVEGARHYVEFSYRLDTSQLPRPMQIGVAGQSEWTLVVGRNMRLE